VARDEYDTDAIEKNMDKGSTLLKEYPDSAIALYKKTLTQSEHADFSFGVRNSLKNIMDIYFGTGNYETLLPVLQQALVICLKSGKLNKALPYIYNSIAGVYARQGNYDDASKYYYQAITTGEKYASSNYL